MDELARTLTILALIILFLIAFSIALKVADQRACIKSQKELAKKHKRTQGKA